MSLLFMAATNQKSGSGDDGGSKSVGRSHQVHSATAVSPMERVGGGPKEDFLLQYTFRTQ